jgi:hypothetical protein
MRIPTVLTTSIGIGEDKAYQKFLLKTMLKESFASKVDFDDDINDFLTPTDIFRSWAIVPCKE